MICEQMFRLKKDGTCYMNCLCRTPELIENYDKAIADTTQVWNCHHRLETHTSDGEKRLVDISRAELIALGTYYDRPPEELIFLTKAEHQRLHNVGKPSPMKGKHHTEEWTRKIAESNKGKHDIGYNKGKQFSEGWKLKLSESHKGKHWYNNGEISVQAKECPEGFVKGRICKLVDGKRVWY